jgi:hypothetical protein
MEPPRSAQQRKSDALSRLAADSDAWIATGDTARNLSRGGRVRVGLGELRDVTIIDGTAAPVDDDQAKDAFAAKHSWDPRKESGDYAYFRIVPDRVQAWREVNELPGRTLMRDGVWLT